MRHHHVAVGVDGSPTSVRALDRAAREAERRGTALRVVYAVPDRDEAPPVLAFAAARVRRRHPRLDVETDAAEGGAVRALERASGAALLTVVGTRGLGPVAGLLLGSVTSRLAVRTLGPLLVVRGEPRRGRPAGDTGAVLVGLEDDTGAAVAACAFEEAERRDVPLTVLHVGEHRHAVPEPRTLVPGGRTGGREALRGRAEESAVRRGTARLRALYPRVDVESRTAAGRAAPALLAAAREAALVVVGVPRDGRLPRSGTLAHALLHRAPCPVLIVPGR
ncbi:universal stress protein [Streptomyces tagetis]|uniref:Universal stress protein n=1 Tax=Streptomyces tagetis TaxID=2820809 RepID=A0A940XLG0_9ACTN|nr:universal stress protein [Streptomyces sp. RG38]MBQ0825953.1 universal stress protein [Streptomyces sp. RG38]